MNTLDTLATQAGFEAMDDNEMRTTEGGYAAAILFLIYVGFLAYGASKM